MTATAKARHVGLALCTGAALTAALTFSSTAHAQRIGVVNLQRAMTETGEGKVVMGRLKRLQDRRQEELDGLQSEITKMEKGIKQMGPMLTESAKAKRVESYRRAVMEFQGKAVKFQEELQQRQADESGRIIEKMRKILSEIGDQDDLGLIVEVAEGGLFHYRKSLDVTNELIRRYDKAHPVKQSGSKGRSKRKRGRTTSKSAS